MEQRRHNPLVDRYVTTDLSLTAILADAPHPLPPVVQALYAIEECLNGKRLAKDALRIAESVDLKHCDPELLLLMLCSWAELSGRLSRINEAETLLHRIRALVSPTTHPVIRARVLALEAVMAQLSGNLRQREMHLREALETVSTGSPRRKFIVWEICLMLARLGRGSESRDLLNEMMWQSNERFPPTAVQLVQFVNAVETGSIKEAADLLPRIATSSPHMLFRQAAGIPYRGYQALLQIMHEVPAGVEGLSGGAPAWITVTRHLAERQPEAALALAREDANRNLAAIVGTGFEAFSLIRAELSAKHPEAALRVLNLRHARGNIHYLDDMFRARAEFLRNNRKSAAEVFAKALQAVEAHGAKGRLDFELRLACELEYGDVMELTREATRREQKPGKTADTDTNPPQTSVPAVTADAGLGQNVGNIHQELIGRGRVFQQLCDIISRFAPLEAPVLITGETGVGKELVARALHAGSPHAKEPFMALNCGSITETLLESELFGYARGAFTGAVKDHKGLFEAAGKGTLFLDEIGNISTRLQQTLLRVLETAEIRPVGSSITRKTHCRVVAATNVDLEDVAQEGLFRSDLLYRLQRLGIHVPPLRDRAEDILPLVRHFIDQGRPIGTHARLSKELVNALREYHWPGNVRELKNVIERMRLLHSDKLSYDIADLELRFKAANAPAVVSDKVSMRPQRVPLPQSARHTAINAVAPATAPPPPVSAPDTAEILKQGNSPMRRQERLRAIFDEHQKLTRSEVISLLQVSPNTATKDLKILCDDGYIERIEPSASSRSFYFQKIT